MQLVYQLHFSPKETDKSILAWWIGWDLNLSILAPEPLAHRTLLKRYLNSLLQLGPGASGMALA
jgi:hypothetical protein